MDVKLDMVADAVYLNITKERVAKTVKVEDRLLIDLDSKGRMVGMEILEASHQGKLVENLQKKLESGIPIDITNTVAA